MTFGRVDWHLPFLTTGKKVVLSLGIISLVGSLAILGLTFNRLQNLRSTVDRPKAGGCPSTLCEDAKGACYICNNPPSTTNPTGSTVPSGSGSTWIEGCKYKYDTGDGAKCGGNPASEQSVSVYDKNGISVGEWLGKHNSFSTRNVLTPKEKYRVVVDKFPDFFYWPWHAYVCVGKHLCFENGKSYCSSSGTTCASDKTTPTIVQSNEVTITIPENGASTAIGFEAGDQPIPNPNTYVCTDPINGKMVSTLTPTLAWNNNITGVTYQNAYITTSSTCSYELGPVQWFDNVPLDKKQVTTTALQPNTTYYWNVYGNGTNGIQGCGCASFKTPAAEPTKYYGCYGKTCAVISGATSNANGCTVAGGTCCAGSSDCATGQTCDTTKTPNSCVTPPTTYYSCQNKTCAVDSSATSNKNGCNSASGACCVSNSDCSSGQTCDTTKTPNACVTPPTTYYSCQNKACAVDSSATSNKNGCTTTGGTCCATNTDCAAGQTCNSATGVCSNTTTYFYCKDKTCTASSSGTMNYHGCTVAGGTCCASGNDCLSGQTCDASKAPNVCTTNNSQVNSCWGNQGADGKCYDCNGDGTINVLDFSCFRSRYGENITQ